MLRRELELTVVSGQINPDRDSLQVNHMSTSSKTDNLIVRFKALTTFNPLDTTVQLVSTFTFRYLVSSNVSGLREKARLCI
jgi:hypothetical protein